MEMEAEVGGMRPQAKEFLRPPDAGGGEERFSPRASGGSPAILTPCFLPVDLSSLCLKPQRLGSAMPARGKEVNLICSPFPPASTLHTYVHVLRAEVGTILISVYK